MATPIDRVILWDRGNDLGVSLRQALIVDDLGVPLLVGDISAMTLRVYTAGTVEPPVVMVGRPDVVMSYAAAAFAWRGWLNYGADLDALPEVRVIMTATVNSRTQRLLDATGRFARPDGR